jgi:hypothetical protein
MSEDDDFFAACERYQRANTCEALAHLRIR